MGEFIAFLIFVGLIFLAIKYWPITLALIALAIIIAIIAKYEPPPDHQKDIQREGHNAKDDIDNARRDYRKRVDDIAK